MFLPDVLAHRPWSVSKAGTLERCTRQYRYKYIERVRDGSSPESGRVGSAVHAVLEQGLGADCADPVFLQDTYIAQTQKLKLLTEEAEQGRAFLDGCGAFIERAKKFKEAQGVTKSWVERELAIDENFNGVAYNDPRALVRGKLDYSALTANKVMLVFDHKTGKPKSVVLHHEQLYIYALLVMADDPSILGVQPIIHYVNEPDLQRLQVLSREYVVEHLRPWLETYLNKLGDKIQAIRDHREAPSTGVLCRWCPFVSVPGCAEGAVYLKKRGVTVSADGTNV